jgi:hypothetical protein
VLAFGGARHGGGVGGIARQHGQALARWQLGGVARQHGDAVAALQRFRQQRAAHEAGGADQQQVHGILQIS